MEFENLKLSKDEKEALLVKKVWEERNASKSYLVSKGLYERYKKNMEFYNGNQWEKYTELSAKMPRIVLNYIKKIVDQKISNISGTNTAIRFHIANDEFKSTRLTKFYEFMSRELDLDYNDEKALLKGAHFGTYFTHFYWNAKAITPNGLQGRLEMEVLDPRCVYVADNHLQSLQKQKYVIIESVNDVENVKDLARRLNGGKFKREEEIKSDDESVLGKDNNLDNKKVTLLCKYFRINGVVHYQYFTNKLVLCSPIPIDPRMNAKKMTDYKVDNSIDSLASKGKNINSTYNFKATLYPICYGVWDLKIDSFYGLDEINDIIGVQKAVNKEFAIQVYNSMQYAFPILLTKQNALQDQEITTAPGQVITDYTTNASWGIGLLNTSQAVKSSTDVQTALIDMIRDAHNAGDIISGDSINRDVSGTAISQLQQQANKPIERQRRLFWKFKEDEAQVLLQFFILYYYNKESGKDYYYTLSTTERENLSNYIGELGMGSSLSEFGIQNSGITNDVFYGEEYDNADFGIQVEIGMGTQFSEIATLDLANQMFLSGSVNNMTVDMLDAYLSMIPDAYANIEELKAFNARRGKTQIDQLNATIQEQQLQVQQLTQMIEELTKNNDALKQEFSQKINTLKGAYTQVEKEAVRALYENQQLKSQSQKVDIEKLRPQNQ